MTEWEQHLKPNTYLFHLHRTISYYYLTSPLRLRLRVSTSDSNNWQFFGTYLSSRTQTQNIVSSKPFDSESENEDEGEGESDVEMNDDDDDCND
eukprot:scaffold67769_cov43-Cyclotella_meneghiniana.AAC.1